MEKKSEFKVRKRKNHKLNRTKLNYFLFSQNKSSRRELNNKNQSLSRKIITLILKEFNRIIVIPTIS
jgi:hypothetical protein